MNDSEHNSLQEIIDKALAEMARDRGASGPLDPDDVVDVGFNQPIFGPG